MTMNYQLDEGIALMTFDDGKANVVGHSLLEALEDLDDVQKVYSNFAVGEEELEKLIA